MVCDEFIWDLLWASMSALSLVLFCVSVLTVSCCLLCCYMPYIIQFYTHAQKLADKVNLGTSPRKILISLPPNVRKCKRAPHTKW